MKQAEEVIKFDRFEQTNQLAGARSVHDSLGVKCANGLEGHVKQEKAKDYKVSKSDRNHCY